MRLVAAAVLAGGQAIRMGGRPKAFLEVSGQRIIDRQLEVLRPLFDEILIVANDVSSYVPLGLPVVPDLVSDAGPLGGILTALVTARADAVLVLACDMPFLCPGMLTLVSDFAREVHLVVPRVAGRPEPLHARYSRSLVPALRDRIASGDLKTARFVASVGARYVDEPELAAVDPSLGSLTNVNTPSELCSCR